MKIGIITHYYKSKNYGGNLQAYALQQFLSDYYPTEQICYSHTEIIKKRKRESFKGKGLGFFLKKVLSRCLRKCKRILYKKKAAAIQFDLEKRTEAILDFNQKIVHSSVCYDVRTIKNANEEYQFFITGSDQVWHPSAVNDAYLLNFVLGKPKISYAASLAVSQIDDVYGERLQKSLKDYKAISVREKTAIKVLQALTEKEIELVVDPVFLLGEEKWTQLALKNDMEGSYVFCYFLGDNRRSREMAKQYAQSIGATIVTLPYLTGEYRKADDNFGDIKLYDVSPEKLLGLIKNAKCIFTDSFHITVFSYIFKKEYFIFHRSARKELASRITDVLKLFDTEERFCDCPTKLTLKYISACMPIDYSKKNEKLINLREKSKNYLLKNLGV